VQDTHARACSVLRKAGWLAPGEASPPRPLATNVFAGGGELPALPIDEPTWTLVKELSLFPAARLRATDEYDPSILAKQTLDICQAFNHFYHECPILGAEPELRELRLRLTDVARAVIRTALGLLGIDQPPEI
jgi:arginyl-tRNA synthetase